jgi:hypothetical protein
VRKIQADQIRRDEALARIQRNLRLFNRTHGR